MAASSNSKTKSNGEKRTIVVMFADIVGASEASNYLVHRKYSEFVKAFQTLFRKTCIEKTEEYFSRMDIFAIEQRGDEGCIIAGPPNDNLVPEIIDAFVLIGLELKSKWLLEPINMTFVTNGLMPVEIAIGIHAGQAFLRPKEKGLDDTRETCAELVPEGYTINLAKRIESSSRHGRYTHIMVSEAAHGLMQIMPDERLYVFDDPQIIDAKGFSKPIRAFEVAHHFLPMNWDELADEKKRPSKAHDEVPTRSKINYVAKAHAHNPTNIWLAEEYIKLLMLYANSALSKKDAAKRYDKRVAKDKYRKARETALSLSDKADPGILIIQGQIEGQCYEYSEERKKYAAAYKFRKFLPNIDWYLGSSYSYEVDYLLEGKDRKLDYDGVLKKFPKKEDNTELISKIELAKKHFRQAFEGAPWSAWYRFDLGCEIIRWHKDGEEKSEGIKHIQEAYKVMPNEIEEAISMQFRTTKDDEGYLLSAKKELTEWLKKTKSNKR